MAQRTIIAQCDPHTDPLAQLAESQIWKLRKDHGQQLGALELVANAMLNAFAMAVAQPEAAAKLIIEHCPSDEVARLVVNDQGEFFAAIMARMAPELRRSLRVVH